MTSQATGTRGPIKSDRCFFATAVRIHLITVGAKNRLLACRGGFFARILTIIAKAVYPDGDRWIICTIMIIAVLSCWIVIARAGRRKCYPKARRAEPFLVCQSDATHRKIRGQHRTHLQPSHLSILQETRKRTAAMSPIDM